MIAQVDMDKLVLSVLESSSTRAGMGTGAIREQLRLPVKDSWRVKRSIEALVAVGAIARRKPASHHGWVYFVDGANRLPPTNGHQISDDRVEYCETKEMAEKLFCLFSTCSRRYGDDDIITLERGRVGLKPSLPIPGRAIGGW